MVAVQGSRQGRDGSVPEMLMNLAQFPRVKLCQAPTPLEYLPNLTRGLDHLVTQGAVQSNHVRQTAAVAAKLGLRCTAMLEHRIETNDANYLGSGNVLLDQIMGI